MYVLEFLCTWVFGNSVEEYGYPFQCNVQDPLVRKLNCHCVTKSTDLKITYPSTRIEKMTAVKGGYTHSSVRMCSEFVCGRGMLYVTVLKLYII